MFISYSSTPYFLIKDSKILINTNEQQKSIAEIKEFKVFLKQGNFFNKEKRRLLLKIVNANFSLLRNDLKLLNDFKNKKLSKKKLKLKIVIFF